MLVRAVFLWREGQVRRPNLIVIFVCIGLWCVSPVHAEESPSKAANAVGVSQHASFPMPPFHAPPTMKDAVRVRREDVAQQALRDNQAVAEARVDLVRARTQRMRAKARHDAIFQTGIDAMRAQTPVNQGITRGRSEHSEVILDTSLARHFDSGTTLSIEMKNGYQRTVFPLMISGLFSKTIDSGGNYLNSLTLSIQQSLLKGRSMAAARSADIAAQIQIELAQSRLQAAQEQAVEEALKAYAQLFYTEAQLVLQRRSLARTRAQIDSAQQQLKAGHIAPFERDRLLGRLAHNEESLLIAHHALMSAARGLMLILHRAPQSGLVLSREGRALYGQAVDAPLRVDFWSASASNAEWPASSSVVETKDHDVVHGVDHDSDNDLLMDAHHEPFRYSKTPDQWCEVAMQHNASLRAASQQIALAESMLVPSQDNQRATLDLHAGVTSTGLDRNMGTSLSKMGQFKNITIFGGVRYRARIHNRAARAKKEAMQADLDRARLQESGARQTVCYGVLDAADRYNMQQQRRRLAAWRLRLAYRGLEAESARFSHGHSTVTRVLDALQSVDVGELEHLHTSVDANVAWWTLQRRAGTILEASGVRVDAP